MANKEIVTSSLIKNSSNTVFLLDGSAFLYRAYHSLPVMHSKSGQVVQVVYGFCRMIKKLLKQFNPEYFVVVWDPRPATGEGVDLVRGQLYEEYKAHRQAAPKDLNAQRDLVKEFASIINLKQVEQPGIEADDILYSLARDFSREGKDIVIISSDKDLGQVVSDKIFIFDPFKDVLYDTQGLEKKYSIPLAKLTFYFALVGDATDNIPGVKGIGPKTAQELVNRFESLDDLYTHIDRIERPRLIELLRAGRENAYISQQLFTLYYCPLALSLDECVFDKNTWYQAREFFHRLDFNSLLKDFPAIPAATEGSSGDVTQSVTSVTMVSPEQAPQFACVTVTEREQLEKLVQEARDRKHIALDTEGDLLRPLESNLVGIAACIEQGTAYYIPLAHKTKIDGSIVSERQLDYETVRSYLNPLLRDTTIKKYFHNAKFDQVILEQWGFEKASPVFDTLIAAHLVSQEGQRLGLKVLSEKYFNQVMITFKDVVAKQGYPDFSWVPLDKAALYAAGDAHQTLALGMLLEQELKKHAQEELFYTLETPLIAVLTRMEQVGITVDNSILGKLSQQAAEKLVLLEHDIKMLLSEEWQTLNINSPKQLQTLLFEHLKLPTVKKTALKTGYSTDHEVLVELSKLHPVPALILRYRELYKLKSTYLDALAEYISPKTLRVHTSFSQTATATGRLASSEPNLQNIPTGIISQTLPLRSAFKAPLDQFFLSADYSQIELRVLAYLSGDVRLHEAFLHGKDIHAQTAAGLFGVSIERVTQEQRALAKRINFSIIYGLSPYGLSKDLSIPYKSAKEYIEKYFEHYPGVVSWMEKVVEEAKQKGYVQTVWGKRRYVPGIYEKNKSEYDLARRIAINTIVQGTAAELMKVGMIALDTLLLREYKSVKIVLQIHDELLLSVPQELIKQVEPVVRSTLEQVVTWPVPLLVTTRYGVTWQEVTK